MLGIAANLDQHLAMTAIQEAGAGLLLRSGTLTRAAPRPGARAPRLRTVVHARGGPVARRVRRWNAPAAFAAFVGKVTA